MCACGGMCWSLCFILKKELWFIISYVRPVGPWTSGDSPHLYSHLIVKSDGIRDRVYGSSFTWVLVSWSQGFSPRSCPLHSFFVTHRVKLVLHVRVLAVCSHCCHGFWMQWSSHILKTAFFPILWLLHPFHCRLLWCSFLLYEELTQKSHLELRTQQFLSILTSPESLH